MRHLPFVIIGILTNIAPVYAFLGTEIAPLLQLVTGQIQEIERLTENVGLARDQARILRQLNDGVNRAVTQIQNLQAIIERARSLDPRALRSLSDLNDLLARAKRSKEEIEDLMHAKVLLADHAIASGALQGDTAYKMGQEMVAAGSYLAAESQMASPGRATQIAAAANSAQMLSSGVQLQTLAQLIQLQAMSLEFQKAQVEQNLKSAQDSKLRKILYERQLSLSARHPIRKATR